MNFAFVPENMVGMEENWRVNLEESGTTVGFIGRDPFGWNIYFPAMDEITEKLPSRDAVEQILRKTFDEWKEQVGPNWPMELEEMTRGM